MYVCMRNTNTHAEWTMLEQNNIHELFLGNSHMSTIYTHLCMKGCNRAIEFIIINALTLGIVCIQISNWFWNETHLFIYLCHCSSVCVDSVQYTVCTKLSIVVCLKFECILQCASCHIQTIVEILLLVQHVRTFNGQFSCQCIVWFQTILILRP